MENEKVDEIVKKALDNLDWDYLDNVALQLYKRYFSKHPLTVQITSRTEELYDEYCRKAAEQSQHITESDRKKLTQELQQAIEFVKRNKRLAWCEKARIILEPLKKGGLLPSQETDKRDLSSPGVDIDLYNEINPRLIQNHIANLRDKKKMKYFIVEDIELRELNILNTINENIGLRDEYLQELVSSSDKPIPQYYHFWSIERLFDYWLPTLTQEKMKRQDLLEQIMVTYTIKRASLGDRHAVDKLYSLFENLAVRIAMKMAKRRDLLRYASEIKQEAKELLKILLSGLPHWWYLTKLAEGEKPGYYQNWLARRIVDYFTKVIINPLTLDISAIHYTDFLISPLEMLKFPTDKKPIFPHPYGKRLNSFLFRPNKNSNLYVWLFGRKRQPKKSITKGFMQGRFCQLMNERLDRYYKVKKEAIYVSLDNENEELSEQDLKIRKEITKKQKRITIKQKYQIDDESVERAIRKLITSGIPKRDAEIFIKNKLQGYKQIKLGKEYSLRRETVNRICKRISLLYPH